MRLLIKNADVHYGANIILEKINFEIHDREKIAVVGRNGCGKTTLLKLITGQLQMSNPSSDESCCFNLAGNQTIGYLNQISFPDEESPVEAELQKVFEPVKKCMARMAEIEERLKSESSEQLLNEYSSLQKKIDAMDGYSCERDMAIMFQKFGFSMEDLKRPIGSFSGGQQTKIAFIKLLLSKPDILLLDEPTNHLDLPTIEWLEGYLKSYKKAVVIVSHDRAFLDGIADVTYEIEYHKMKRYSGNYSAFVRQKEEALAKQEKDYEAQQKEIKRLSEWVEKWRNTPTKVSTAHSKEKAIEHMVLIEKPQRFDRTTFRAHFEPRTVSYNDVLEMKNLSIGYDRELAKLTLTLRRGERLAIVGANGKGKSTLLKTLVGLIPALDGFYQFGKNVEWGYFDQQKAVINNEDPEQTVLDNFWETYPTLKREEVRSALGAFVFSQDEVEKKLGQLSGGEKVRLALCKMFYTRPNLLILDEPTNHMDMLGKESLENMLKEYSGTVIFVSHDRYFIKQIATRVLDIGEEESRSVDKAKASSAGDAPSAQTAAAATVGVKNPGKLRAKAERKVEKIESQIAESEERQKAIRAEMENPDLASDFEHLMECQRKLDEEGSLQEELLEQLMEAEEELASLD